MELVGTVHVDIDGPRKLENLLHLRKPRVITLEFSEALDLDREFNLALKTRRDNYQIIKSNIGNSAIQKLYLEIATTATYELIQTVIYSRQTQAKLIAIDHPEVKSPFDFLQVESYLISELQRTAKLLDERLAKEIGDDRFNYSAVRSWYVAKVNSAYWSIANTSEVPSMAQINGRELSLDDEQYFDWVYSEKGIEDRDEHMCRRVLEIQPNMHIGGNYHIFGQEYNQQSLDLFGHLGGQFNRIRLADIDLQ